MVVAAVSSVPESDPVSAVVVADVVDVSAVVVADVVVFVVVLLVEAVVEPDSLDEPVSPLPAGLPSSPQPIASVAVQVRKNPKRFSRCMPTLHSKRRAEHGTPEKPCVRGTYQAYAPSQPVTIRDPCHKMSPATGSEATRVIRQRRAVGIVGAPACARVDVASSLAATIAIGCTRLLVDALAKPVAVVGGAGASAQQALLVARAWVDTRSDSIDDVALLGAEQGGAVGIAAASTGLAKTLLTRPVVRVAVAGATQGTQRTAVRGRVTHRRAHPTGLAARAAGRALGRIHGLGGLRL